jgi:hypothetical protein
LTGVTTRGYQKNFYRPSDTHYHRVSWKVTSSGDRAASNVTLACNPKELGFVLRDVYLAMYPHQGRGSDFEPPLHPPEPGFGRLRSPSHYTKRGFAALMVFLKGSHIG